MAANPLPAMAKRNIDTIAAVERELHDRRSAVERLGGRIAGFFGSLGFICAHALFFVTWILLNGNQWERMTPFDPYPFPFLGLVVAVEFIFLTTFVLMNQSIQARRQEQWAHLNLQICLLTEHEVTKSIQLLDLICERLDVTKAAKDHEIKDLAKATPVETLVHEIHKV